MSPTNSPTYQARRDASPWALSVTAALVLATIAVPIALPDNPGGYALAVASGLAALLRLVPLVQRQVAFRADERGVLLGGGTLRYRSQTAFSPWSEIRSLVIWDFHAPASPKPTPHIGLVRQTGAAPLPSANSATSDEVRKTVAKGISAALLRDSRAITGWRLDPQKLLAVLATHAPHVTIEDHTGRHLPKPDDYSTPPDC